MTKFRLFFALLLVAAVQTAAHAQYQTPQYSVPVGRGAGASGFDNAPPGVAGGLLRSNGPSAKPTFAVPADTTVATIAALKAVDTTTTTSAFLTASGRTGNFVWRTGDYTNQIAADTNNGVYVKANAVAASAGAWVRDFDFVNYDVLWFGPVADYATDNATLINTVIATADAANTLTAAGRQGASYINIPGSVRFSSTSLSFLPSAGHAYIYVNFFANSNLTKGVPTGGDATNEQHTISVNSGYPGDPGGGFVAEWRRQAIVHPAMVIEQQSIWPGADAHMACSIPLVLGQCLGTGQTRVPTSNIPVNSSLFFLKDGVGRAHVMVSNYGDGGAFTGLTIGTEVTDLALAGQAGFSSTGWCGGACVPTTGNVIQGATSGALGYLTAPPAGDVMNLRWLSGVFVAGEFVKSGGNTSTKAILGGGVSYGGATNNVPLWFGINTPAITLGNPPGEAITAFTVPGRVTLTTSARTFANKVETVTNASLLFSNTTGTPTTGRQIVLDASNRLVAVNGVANGTGSNATGRVGATSAHSTFTNAAGVSANAFNIASVTRTGAGTYAVVFINNLANANYSIALGKSDKADFPTYTSKAVSGFTVANFNSGAAAADLVGTVDITVIGGQ